MQFQVKRPLVIIVGPTAVGKTDLAVEVAARLNGEIISADSRYLYKGMDIGTAKPKVEQLNRAKHYLIDVANIEENWSLAVYKEKALSTFEKVWEKSQLPILVGGTGQYIRSIIEGWQIPERQPNVRLRQTLKRIAEKDGKEILHQKLGIIDPQAATWIDYRNLRRVIRALEVSLTTGKKFSEQRSKEEIDFLALIKTGFCPAILAKSFKTALQIFFCSSEVFPATNLPIPVLIETFLIFGTAIMFL